MGEFGGIISAAIAYRGTREDCETLAAHIESESESVPTRVEAEGRSWVVLVPFSDDPVGRAAARILADDGVIAMGA